MKGNEAAIQGKMEKRVYRGRDERIFYKNTTNF